MLIANSGNNVESRESSSNSDSLTSLSEQVAILEERLADCKSLINSLIYFDSLFNLMICHRYVYDGTCRQQSQDAPIATATAPVQSLSKLSCHRADRPFLQVQSIKEKHDSNKKNKTNNFHPLFIIASSHEKATAT